MRTAQHLIAGTCATTFRVDISLDFSNLIVIHLTHIGEVLHSHVLPDRACSIWSVGNDSLEFEIFWFLSLCFLQLPGVANVAPTPTDSSGASCKIEQNPVPIPGHIQTGVSDWTFL